ncbi:MAG: class I SAM-dependent methyltransferase, partial [Dehalococcoidales bacterium]
MDVESNWDSHWEEESKRSFWHEPDRAVIDLKNRLDRAKTPDVLDLGCGVGRHALLFAESGFNVTALDYSQEALNTLRQKALEKGVHIKIIKGSYSEDVFPEESFDLILAYNVLYHGYSQTFKNAICLIHKWLKSEGLFFFTCPSRRDDKYGNGEEVAKNTYKSLNSVHPGDIHYFASEADIA